MIRNSILSVRGEIPSTARRGRPIAGQLSAVAGLPEGRCGGSLRPSRHSGFARLALAICGVLAVCESGSAQTWTRLAHNAPGGVELMLLLSDGTVMCSNQAGPIGNGWYKLTPDIHGSYVNGTWTTLAAMHDTRLYYSSQVLKDGRVFVAGGEYGTGSAKAEVYDPTTNVWTQADIPPSVLDPTQNSPVTGGPQTIYDANSEILPDGRVLISPVGPAVYGGTIIYNPATSSWVRGPTILHGGYQDEASWVKLPDSTILTVDSFVITSERYNPVTNMWINDRSTPVQLYDSFDFETGPATLLPSGKVIFIGATGHTCLYTPSGSTTMGTWVAGPDVPNGRSMPDAPSAMMVDGKLLCVVSAAPSFPGDYPSPAYFYSYDYIANTFTQVNGPTGLTDNIASFQAAMVLLPDGNVLYSHFGQDLYVCHPAGTPLTAAKPTVVSVIQNPDGSFHLTGRGLNGITEAEFGDDLQMASNYPLVRLTNTATTNVYFARTYNWSSTGVMTGSTVVSTEFKLPANLPNGTYTRVVIANGVASDAFGNGINNDNCADAAPISEGSTPYSTATATTDGPLEPALGADPTINQDIWFTYQSSCTGQATVSLCDANFDSRLAIYDGGCPTGPGTAIAVNDNFCGLGSQVSFAVTDHHTYTIRVGGTGTARGSGTVQITCTSGSNDPCGSAAPIFEGTAAYSTVGATTDGPVEPQLFPGSDAQVNQDIWYIYVASCAGMATANLCDASFDSRIAIYDGVCPTGPGTAIAGNDNACGLASKVSWNAQYHHVYTIRIGGTGSATGSGSIVLSCNTCYANCDGSTTQPTLNINDFTCFLNKFAAGDSYANCDNSTSPPTLNILDFTCFLNHFAAGC